MYGNLNKTICSGTVKSYTFYHILYAQSSVLRCFAGMYEQMSTLVIEEIM